MQRLIVSGLIIVCVFLGTQKASAYSNPGNPTGYVNDFAQVLDPVTKLRLERDLGNFHASTTNEIAIAIVPSMNGDYIENYAARLFKDWGIGTRDRDNGVLIVLAIQERKIRIEVGYGLEGALPDSVAQGIINTTMTPSLRDGNYDAAVLNGVNDIKEAVQYEYATNAVPMPITTFDAESAWKFVVAGFFLLQWLVSILARSTSWYAGGIVGVIAAVVLAVLFKFSFMQAVLALCGLGIAGLILDFIVSSAYTGAKVSGGSIPWYAGGNGSWGAARGGGFGGFGGGRSGGGGASGGW
jgi:uncharacterized protein